MYGQRPHPRRGPVLRLYFDSAYVAKCYLNEPDALEVRKLVKRSSALCSSAWCLAELACVLHRQIREGFLDPEAADRQRSLFLADLDDGIWELFPLTDRLLRRVGDLTRSLPTSCFLRAGDAVHLATALENGFSEIWTNDRHLKAAAVHVGITSRSVLAEL